MSGSFDVGRGMPHRPGHLLVAAEGSQRRQQRREVLAGQQLVGREAERIEVARRTDRSELGREQLGGHVFRRALQETAFLVARAAGQAEVAQLHAVLGPDENVAGLDIAVDHTVGMQEGQAAQAIDQDGAELVEIHRLAFGRRLEAAAHQLQDQPAARPHHVVDREDVRVLRAKRGVGPLANSGPTAADRPGTARGSA